MGVLSAVLPRFGGGGGGGGVGGVPPLHVGSGHVGSSVSSSSASSGNALSSGGSSIGRHGSDASRGRPPTGPGVPPLGGGAGAKPATPTDVRKALHKLKGGGMTVAAFLALLSRLGAVLPDETLERMVELLSSDKLLPTLLLLLTSDRPAVSAPRATSLDARLPFLRSRKKLSPSISPTSISPAASPQLSPVSTAVSMDGTTFVVPGQLSIGAPAKVRRPKGSHFSRRSASSTDAMYAAAADEEQVELPPVPAREEYAANWVAATLVVHGPPVLREAILARTGCMATLTAYLDGGVVRPPAVTAVVGQVLCALLHTNRAKVADAFYHTPRLLRNLVRHIGVPCIAALLPRLVAERRGFADREPFDFAEPHRRAVAMMGQAGDAGAVGRLTAAFVSAAAGGRPRNGHGHHGLHGRRSLDKDHHGHHDHDPGEGQGRKVVPAVAEAIADGRVRAEAEHAAVGVLTAAAATVADIGVRAMMAARKPAEHEESGDAAFVRHLGLISAGTYNSALDEMDPLVTPGHLADILDAALLAWRAGSSRSAVALEAALGAIATVLNAVRGAAASGVKAVRVRARALDASRLEGVVVSQAAPLLAILHEALPLSRQASLTASPSFESELIASSVAASVAGGEVGWPPGVGRADDPVAPASAGTTSAPPVLLGSTRMAIVDCLYAVVAGGRAGPAAALLVTAGGGRCLLRLADAHRSVSMLTQRVAALVAAAVAAAASPAGEGTEDSTEESGHTTRSRGASNGCSGGGGCAPLVDATVSAATVWALLAPAPAGADLLAWLSARSGVPEVAAATAALNDWGDGLERAPAAAGASAADVAAWPSHVAAYRSVMAGAAAAAAAAAAAPPLGGVYPRAAAASPLPPSREVEQLGEDGGHTLHIFRVVDLARSAASPSALAVDSRERSLTSLVGDAASGGAAAGAPGSRLLFWRGGGGAKAGRPSWQARMQ